MKINIGPLSLLTGLGIVTLWTLPSNAASLSISNFFLKIDNFNRPAFGAIATGDNQVVNIAENGISQTDLRGSAFFTSDSLGTHGQIDFYNQTLGWGESYFGKADIKASLEGTFFVPANQALTFDFSISRQLLNSQINDDKTVASSGGLIDFSWRPQFLAQPELSGTFLQEFNFLSQINANSLDFEQPNYFRFFRGNSITINNHLENIIITEQQESITTFLTGSFQWIAPQDTFVFLEFSAQSCTYSSSQLQTCMTIPEPRSHPIIFPAFVSLYLLSWLVKKIIQFINQPFRK